MNHYIIFYRPPRETFLEDSTPEEDAVIENHYIYLQKLLSSKRLVLAGRTDDAGERAGWKLERYPVHGEDVGAPVPVAKGQIPQRDMWNGARHAIRPR